jgi:hypothetical protein
MAATEPPTTIDGARLASTARPARLARRPRQVVAEHETDPGAYPLYREEGRAILTDTVHETVDEGLAQAELGPRHVVDTMPDE